MRRPATGVGSWDGAIQALDQGATMSDKSPRQAMSKKSAKSIKEKRAEKRDKAHQQTFSDKFDHDKK
jgi:hypothetical protein